jgi:hypothetical protein
LTEGQNHFMLPLADGMNLALVSCLS